MNATNNAKENAMRSQGKVIYGNEISAKVDDVVLLDSRNISEKLGEWDIEPCEGFPGADFSWPSAVVGSLAVNVHVTGRTFQYVSGGVRAVRCRVEFVGDCEPSSFASGWLFV
jgi:hypothetical protein